MDRRAFLLGTAAAAAAACTPGESDSSPVTTAPTTTSTIPTTTTTAGLPQVTLLDSPAADLDDNAFGLGVASGDPDASSVVLWTRLVGNLPDAVSLVWDLAEDPDFSRVVGAGSVDTHFDLGYSVKVIASGLRPATNYWYRFRSSSLTSPVGRTRTLGGSDPVTLGVSSCQRREDGEWGAHRDLAADPDVDVVVWLGDFIYDRGAETLDVYRSRYSEYRRDPFLQACSAAHPWICTIDDHEVTNDFDIGVDPARRFAGLQAWWENTPTRLPAPTLEDGLQIFRAVDLTDSTRLLLLDVRQYREPGTTLLGETQLAWLEDAVVHRGTRTVIGSPVVVSRLGLDQQDLEYGWETVPTDSDRLREALKQAPKPLLMSGDLHTAGQLNFTLTPAPDSDLLAPELMAPAISSAFPADFVDLLPLLPLVSPTVEFVDPTPGWMKLRLADSGASSSFRFMVDVTDPNSAIRVGGAARFP